MYIGPRHRHSATQKKSRNPEQNGQTIKEIYKKRPRVPFVVVLFGSFHPFLSSAETATKSRTSFFLCLSTYCIEGACSPVIAIRVWGRGTQITRQKKSLVFFLFIFLLDGLYLSSDRIFSRRIRRFMCIRRYSCILVSFLFLFWNSVIFFNF